MSPVSSPNEIGREFEDSFLSASLPGGQTAIVTTDGEQVTIRFRWICLTAHASIGAVWRCFVEAGNTGAGSWRAIEHDYIFDAGGGVVLNSPAAAAIPCADELTKRDALSSGGEDDILPLQFRPREGHEARNGWMAETACPQHHDARR